MVESDPGSVALRVKISGVLEKRDPAGEVFEQVVIEDDGAGTVIRKVIYRRPGEPAESYTPLPYDPS